MIIKISKRIKFYLPIEQDRLLKIIKYVIIALSATALIFGVVCGVLYFSTDRLKLEAGSSLSAADITGNENSYFGDDFDPESLNHPGVYYFTVITDGKTREVRIEVVDNKAPAITVKEIKWPQSSKIRAPKPEDFIDTVIEPDVYTGEFIEPLPEFNKDTGVYRAKVRFTDGSGNKTKIFDVVLRLELDSEAPEIQVLQDTVEIKVGADPDETGRGLSVYYDLVEVTDNCAGDLSLTVDDSGVNYTESGSYTVYFTASDMVGNKSDRVSVTVLIVDEISESGE